MDLMKVADQVLAGGLVLAIRCSRSKKDEDSGGHCLYLKDKDKDVVLDKVLMYCCHSSVN